MKRRSFLSMLGAALAAPALPATAGVPSRSLAALAAAHARKYPFVSVIGLSRRVGVSVPEAETLLIDLSERGLVGTVNSCAHGPISACSRVFRPVPVTVPKLARTDKALGDDRYGLQSGPRRSAVFEVDLSALLARLRGIATDHAARHEGLIA